MVVTKEEPAKAASLVASVQKLTEARKDKNLKAFVVFKGGPELAPAIQKIAEEKKITIPMTFLPKGADDPGLKPFKINTEANNTVLLYNRRVVAANFVNVTDKSVKDVEKAADEMLAPK
jgi:hypothetical protein